MPPIRFGVMCNGTVFPEWEAHCLQNLLDLEGVEPALLIIDKKPPIPTFWKKVKTVLRVKGVFWFIYCRLVRTNRSIAKKPVDMTAMFSKVPKVYCEVIRKGKFSVYFSEKDITVIRRYGLDFVLRFEFGIIRGEILDVPRYGIWSFHHGDEEKYRGTPPCFWEIYNGDIVTGAILQRLTERLDAGIVLQKGFFKTINYSYVHNRDLVYFGSADWPAKVCRDILNGNAAYLDETSPSQTNAPILRNPGNWQMMLFMFKLIRNRIERFVHKEE